MPSSSLKDHSEKCRYAEILGTDVHKLDQDQLTMLRVEPSFLYQNCRIESAYVGKVYPHHVLTGMTNGLSR